MIDFLLSAATAQEQTFMATVISVRFKPNGKAYFFDPGDLPIEKGEYVIVDTSRGTE